MLLLHRFLGLHHCVNLVLWKCAPKLHILEIRRPVYGCLRILTQNTAPSVWADVIPKLAELSELRVIKLTFPGSDEVDTDLLSIAAARKVLKESNLQQERKLVIRRVLAPHYTTPHREDLLHSISEEIFN